jgi:hypothetical protein
MAIVRKTKKLLKKNISTKTKNYNESNKTRKYKKIQLGGSKSGKTGNYGKKPVRHEGHYGTKPVSHEGHYGTKPVRHEGHYGTKTVSNEGHYGTKPKKNVAGVPSTSSTSDPHPIKEKIYNTLLEWHPDVKNSRVATGTGSKTNTTNTMRRFDPEYYRMREAILARRQPNKSKETQEEQKRREGMSNENYIKLIRKEIMQSSPASPIVQQKTSKITEALNKLRRLFTKKATPIYEKILAETSHKSGLSGLYDPIQEQSGLSGLSDLYAPIPTQYSENNKITLFKPETHGTPATFVVRER